MYSTNRVSMQTKRQGNIGKQNKTVTSLTQDELLADKLPDKIFDMGHKQKKTKGKKSKTYNFFRN